MYIVKRNANAFSLNAIVDVRFRRRRHEMILALHSLYIFTGNDVTGYFRSAVNRINALILGHVLGRDFSITAQPILKKFTVLKTVIQGLHFSCVIC